MEGKIYTRIIASPEGAKQFISAIVSVMTNGYLKRCERKVQISLREEGSEVLYGEDDIKATMKASSRAEEYSLRKAIDDPGSMPDYAELALRSEQSFCGRLALSSREEDEEEPADSIVIITGSQSAQNIPYKLSQAGNAHVTVAVLAEENAGTGDASAAVSTDLLTAIAGRDFSCFWYSPVGFMSDGTKRTSANASPIGIVDIFWDIAGKAAEYRTAVLSDIISESEKMIGLRTGAFQKNSPRRQLELNWSRRIYAGAVREIFAAEQMAALAGGKPLAYEK